MKNSDLRNLDCPHSSLKEQARIASGWRSREVGRGAGPKFGEITPLAPHLAIPHHPTGLTLFQTEVHASFAPFSRLLNTLDAQTENNARHADKFSLVSFEQVLKDERRATINTLTLTIPDCHGNY